MCGRTCLPYASRVRLAALEPAFLGHLDGVDPFGIHGVGRDGDVQALVAFAGARDEVTEGSDPGVALTSS